MEATSLNVCRCLQLDANCYSKQIKDGHEIRKYNNRVTIIGADLADVNLDYLARTGEEPKFVNAW